MTASYARGNKTRQCAISPSSLLSTSASPPRRLYHQRHGNQTQQVYYGRLLRRRKLFLSPLLPGAKRRSNPSGVIVAQDCRAPFKSLQQQYSRTSARTDGGMRESSFRCRVADIALPEVAPSHGDHGAVGPKPQRVIATCGDFGDVCPATHIALPV
jgi:hypothetical protein